MLLPGMFYFDNDRHSTNAGAIGAFGFRMGAEISRVLATGTNWVSVPKSVRISLRGKLKPHVYARDIGFYLARLIKAGELDLDLDYRVVEFAGDIDQFGLSERTALCNSPTELGAYGVFFPPSQALLAFAAERAQQSFTPVYADPDAQYEREVAVDIGDLEPQVVRPGGIQTSVDVSGAVGPQIGHAFLGACGSGMYEDFVTAAAFLKGRRVPDHVRLFIAPGTEASTRRMSAEGLLDVFMQAGAILLPAGCGPCNDAVVGPLHDGEVSISTASNSNAGRFGSKKAQLYLGSPATVAASAVAGAIVDPRTAVQEGA
jgi:3-isopropylmalate/(R)-2-methylmalate dehydratase large subunit